VEPPANGSYCITVRQGGGGMVLSWGFSLKKWIDEF
jgi:hypothetical protein